MSNVSALPDSKSISEAWIAAVSYLKSNNRSCYNLIYAIERPDERTDSDLKLYERYDALARTGEVGTVTTVANTIFPLDTYLKFGSPAFYDHYEKDIFPNVKKGWGTYFERMTRRKGTDGIYFLDKSGGPLNPLATVVRKLTDRVNQGRGTKTHYEVAIADEGFELTTYLPERDSILHRSGPCLSHVSFKLDDSGALRMTAFYRSHFYLERALGNLLGLARLQGKRCCAAT